MNPTVQHKNLYKPGLQLFTADWLSMHNHKTNREEEMPDICITISITESCIEIPDSMTAEEIRAITLDDKHIGLCRPSTQGLAIDQTEVQKEL